MIHNSSTDPVLIKKISLKIWSLRDEIEARIQERIDQGSTLSEEEISKIRDAYSRSLATSNNVIPLKTNAELDTSEDEMAKAMAEAMGEEEKAESSTETNAESLSANVVAIGAAPEDTITLQMDLPPIPDSKISKGKTVLSEINMDKMFFFCNKSFTEGQSIVIQFCIPKTFLINADILYCRPFNLKSRIISQNNYTHRALVKFTFLKEGERALLRQFIQSIEPDVTRPEKTAEKEDSGDFSELDDLGL